MSSSAEAETGAMYLNATNAIPIRQALKEMGHTQGRTPIYKQTIRQQEVMSTKQYNQNSPNKGT